MEKERKEIGMEKLVELLNEYEFNVADTYNYAEMEATEDDLERLSERIISKKYGFIKWLVENDKIDTSKYNFCAEVSGICGDVYKNYGAYESLLMLLSISSSPIDDLILYLK